MRDMRRHLSSLTTVWLLCQLAAFVAAPIVLGTPRLSAAAAVEVCDCPGAEPGQACPMHKHGAEEKSDTAPWNDCRLQSTCDPSSAALVSLMGTLGYLTAAANAVDYPEATRAAAITSHSPRGLASIPEAPPPRS